MDASILPPDGRRRWFFEPQIGLLALLVFGIYFTRLADLTLRGEETRRARVAIEMLETGDFIVPREQGRLFPDRPPLGNWVIALSMLACGNHDVVAVRLPTVLATLLTTILIYGYSRRFLSALGSMAAGAAYATMGQVLQLGFLAETEATLTLFVGASLLVWHGGYASGWPKLVTWTAGYALVGLAALAKGPQGPIYFGGAVAVYLALKRDWRMLFSWSHLAGLAVFAAVVGVWQIPYSSQVEWEKVLQTWGHTSAARFDYSNLWPVVKHLLTYPWEILGCLLPWSPWLAAFSNRDFRRSLGAARDPAIFLTVAILVAFPTCWLAPQARGRYFMPLYPCFAPLVGLAIERALAASRVVSRAATGNVGWLGLSQGEAPVRWGIASLCRQPPSTSQKLARMWRVYFTAAASLLVLAGAAVPAISVAGLAQEAPFSQPLGFAAAYAALAWLAAAVVWKASSGERPRQAAAGLLALAGFLGLTFSGLMMNDWIRRSEDIAGHVAALKTRLPPDVRLVSFGRAHHPFVYYYGETIPWLDWPTKADASAPEAVGPGDYFCFHSVRGRRKPLPFDWVEVAEISCDRYRREQPVDAMVIGRRVASSEHDLAKVDDEKQSRK
ncbi:MAG TPA: glycosyltransferase family 39 protein [Pirellulales bacterium]|nr:glycosyltransferase family 39 protein [Pirellulales bacterium]